MGLTAGQQRCVETLDRPLVVAAGAGSGKTFTLTKRIVNALQTGYLNDIDEVCAITFTNKAAAELKSRIKSELRACGMVDQALKVDDAWVSTIHGMCARILRAHALELGIDPAFQVADGVLTASFMAQAVDGVLAEARDGSSERVDALFAEYSARAFGGMGASVEGMVSELATAASSHVDGVDAFVMPGVTAAPHMAVSQALEIVDGLLMAASGEKEGPKRDDWMAATADQVSAARQALDAGLGDAARALEVLAPIKLVKTFGSKGYKSEVDEARGAFAALLMELRLGAAAGHLETLVELARRALGSYDAMKRQSGVLDNNDLLVLAARAIEENPRIAERYSDKFRLVMVDEFQDTDQMQVDMIKRLAGAGAARLCTVGDAQQSIYRFRGADVSVYRRHLATVRETGPDGVIHLSENFRSHHDVLAFVDRVFERPGMFGGEFMSLSAGRDEGRIRHPFSPARPRVVVQQTSSPWRGVSSDYATRYAADRIAAEFESLVDSGHSAGEMVILLGRMANAGVYAQALRDRGIPCVISGGSVFAGTVEAQVISELARVLANPAQTQSLFNVLASPMFGLTAGDVLDAGGLEGFVRASISRYSGEGTLAAGSAGDGDLVPGAATGEPSAAEGGRVRTAPCGYEPTGVAFSPRLECALRVMGRALRDVRDVPVTRVVERVLADSGWLARLECQGAEGLASAANALKAVRMLADAERAGAMGPATVAARFEEMLENSKEAPGALSVSGGDSVRIMTIHASKGLEFPIVAVAEVKEDKAPSSKLLTASVGGRIYLSLDLSRTVDDPAFRIDSATLDQTVAYVLGEAAGEDELAHAVEEDAGALHRRLALREYLAEGDREEAKRLLYVALTRAKEALVVSMRGKRTKDNPGAVPKSAMAGVVEALVGPGETFASGKRQCEYGGALPATFFHWALEPEDELGGVVATGRAEEPRPFMVPRVECADPPKAQVFKPLHQGVFSYSSISDASHGGGVLDMLADAHFAGCDDAVEDGFGSAAPAPALAVPTGDFWDDDPSAAFDEDRATDLGTAFHRLAQYAVVTRGGAALTMPDDDRISALARTCNLDALQRDRLVRALNRWFGCDLSREMANVANLSAEVPFFVKVPVAGGEPGYLEGEIDLLALSEDASRATVVDYKTGGRSDETADDLRVKHVLQASCYAYAIMLQGVAEVEAVFVRVERPRGDDPAQPQCVRYRFSSADLPELQRAIASIRAR